MALRVWYGAGKNMNTNENRQHRNETRNQGTVSVECWKTVPGIEGVERWWAGLRPVERQVARVIAGMMQEVTATKRVEIRREGAEIRARFIYMLKQPEKGCLTAVMLPECDRGAAN